MLKDSVNYVTSPNLINPSTRGSDSGITSFTERMAIKERLKEKDAIEALRYKAEKDESLRRFGINKAFQEKTYDRQGTWHEDAVDLAADKYEKAQNILREEKTYQRGRNTVTDAMDATRFNEESRNRDLLFQDRKHQVERNPIIAGQQDKTFKTNQEIAALGIKKSKEDAARAKITQGYADNNQKSKEAADQLTLDAAKESAADTKYKNIATSIVGSMDPIKGMRNVDVTEEVVPTSEQANQFIEASKNLTKDTWHQTPEAQSMFRDLEDRQAEFDAFGGEPRESPKEKVMSSENTFPGSPGRQVSWDMTKNKKGFGQSISEWWSGDKVTKEDVANAVPDKTAFEKRHDAYIKAKGAITNATTDISKAYDKSVTDGIAKSVPKYVDHTSKQPVPLPLGVFNKEFKNNAREYAKDVMGLSGKELDRAVGASMNSDQYKQASANQIKTIAKYNDRQSAKKMSRESEQIKTNAKRVKREETARNRTQTKSDTVANEVFSKTMAALEKARYRAEDPMGKEEYKREKEIAKNLLTNMKK